MSADSIGNFNPPTHIERDDGSESLEHTLGDSMRRMRGQAWVSGASDQRMHLKPFSEQHGCLLCPFQPKREGPGTTYCEERLKRSWCGPG
jgi:hypothetical protein